MKLGKIAAGGLVGAAMLAIGSAGHAAEILQGGGFTVNWTLSPAAAGFPALTATAVFSDFDYISDTQLAFNLNVTNTTDNTGPPSYGQATLTSFGWASDPVLTAVTQSSDFTAVASPNPNIPGGFTVDVCFYQGQNCAGGGGPGGPQGLAIGESTGIFQVTLTFAADVPPLDFNTFVARFQTSQGSVTGAGFPGNGHTDVPEPASLALLGMGLLGLGYAMRRRRAH